jgi:hypothetical protein
LPLYFEGLSHNYVFFNKKVPYKSAVHLTRGVLEGVRNISVNLEVRVENQL